MGQVREKIKKLKSKMLALVRNAKSARWQYQFVLVLLFR
jgi:hypothetical protein